MTIFGTKAAFRNIGGRGEIRTHGGLAPTTVFKTVALNRSATLPNKKSFLLFRSLAKTVLKLRYADIKT